MTIILLMSVLAITSALPPDGEEAGNAMTMVEITDILTGFAEEMKLLKEKNKDLETEMQLLKGQKHQTRTDVYSPKVAYGCDLDIITLTCDAGVINVTSAFYGQYFLTCAECCAPLHSYDCTESMHEHRPTDWVSLKLLCNNNTSCQYENKGSLVESCEEPYYADYLEIYYECSQSEGVLTPVIGFSASASVGRQYGNGEKVIFDSVITNLGNAYSTSTNEFTCPIHGLYSFTSTFFNHDATEVFNGVIVVNNKKAGETVTGVGQDNEYSGSVTTFVECLEGEKVWVESDLSAYLDAGPDPLTLFSGALISAL